MVAHFSKPFRACCLAIGRQKICAFFKNFYKSRFSQLSRACCLASGGQNGCAFLKNSKKSFFAFFPCLLGSSDSQKG
ncbi:hypothetical protein T11_2479 [Trichinella zimbabwensis]|uniref:Uncharacterized protein n=1 Tax=Trichinella zimbabwensis TaxID=268475 RepID=A0A0V1GAR8_9BILA|nr:hypothetical protein T11_2479 [Trichinella zimbabwensis]